MKIRKYIILFSLALLLYSPNSYADYGLECPKGSEKICPVTMPGCTNAQKVVTCKPYCPPIGEGTCQDYNKVTTPITKFMKYCPRGSVVKPNKFTGNIYRCAKNMIFRAGDRLIISYTSLFASWIHYITIFAVVLFGIKMMYGQTREKGITVIMIMKIMLVLYLTSYPGTFRLLSAKDVLYQGSTNIVINLIAIPDPLPTPDHITFKNIVDLGSIGSGFRAMLCTPEGRILGVGNGIIPATKFCKGIDGIFDQIDSMIFSLYGLDKFQAHDQNMQSNYYFVFVALIVGLFFTGAMGLTLAMIAITYLFVVVVAFAQIVMMFIISMVAINFLVAIAPIAMAGILFDQTKRMTKVWFSYLITYTILPIVLAAFLVIIGFMVYKIVGSEEGIQARNKMSAALGKMKEQKLFGDLPQELQGGVNSGANAEDIFNGLANSYQKSSTEGKSTASDMWVDEVGNLRVHVIPIDPTQVGPNLNNGDLKKISAIMMAMIVFLLVVVGIIKEIPKIAAGIAGSAAASAADIAAKPLHFIEQKIEGTGRTFGGNILKSN